MANAPGLQKRDRMSQETLICRCETETRLVLESHQSKRDPTSFASSQLSHCHILGYMLKPTAFTNTHGPKNLIKYSFISLLGETSPGCPSLPPTAYLPTTGTPGLL